MIKKRNIKEEILKVEILNRIKLMLNSYNHKFKEITAIYPLNQELFIGNIKLFDLNKLNEVLSKLSSLLEEYGKNSDRVESCSNMLFNKF